MNFDYFLNKYFEIKRFYNLLEKYDFSAVISPIFHPSVINFNTKSFNCRCNILQYNIAYSELTNEILTTPLSSYEENDIFSKMTSRRHICTHDNFWIKLKNFKHHLDTLPDSYHDAFNMPLYGQIFYAIFSLSFACGISCPILSIIDPDIESTKYTIINEYFPKFKICFAYHDYLINEMCKAVDLNSFDSIKNNTLDEYIDNKTAKDVFTDFIHDTKINDLSRISTTSTLRSISEFIITSKYDQKELYKSFLSDLPFSEKEKLEKLNLDQIIKEKNRDYSMISYTIKKEPYKSMFEESNDILSEDDFDKTNIWNGPIPMNDDNDEDTNKRTRNILEKQIPIYHGNQYLARKYLSYSKDNILDWTLYESFPISCDTNDDSLTSEMIIDEMTGSYSRVHEFNEIVTDFHEWVNEIYRIYDLRVNKKTKHGMVYVYYQI